MNMYKKLWYWSYACCNSSFDLQHDASITVTPFGNIIFQIFIFKCHIYIYIHWIINLITVYASDVQLLELNTVVHSLHNRSSRNHVHGRWQYGSVNPLNRRRKFGSFCCWNNSSLNVVGFPRFLRWNVTPPYCDVLPVEMHNKTNYDFIFFSDTKCLSPFLIRV